MRYDKQRSSHLTLCLFLHLSGSSFELPPARNGFILVFHSSARSTLSTAAAAAAVAGIVDDVDAPATSTAIRLAALC